MKCICVNILLYKRVFLFVIVYQTQAISLSLICVKFESGLPVSNFYHFFVKTVSVSICHFFEVFVTFCHYFKHPSLLVSFVGILLLCRPMTFKNMISNSWPALAQKSIVSCSFSFTQPPCLNSPVRLKSTN